MLYDRIKTCANEKKISITNLEKALGFGNGTIGKWKTYMPSATKLQKVADFFEKPIEYFLQQELPETQDNKTILHHPNNESNPSTHNIAPNEAGFSKQELEIIITYRELSIAQQAEFIQFLLNLK